MINQIADEILSLIELEEARLLKWGFVSGELDLDRELSRLVEGSKVWNSAEIHNITIPQIIDNLLDRCLIFATQRGYRSRFAETVRLLFLLKQRFSFQDWLTAPRLVSDYKLELRRRQYPKRNIKIASLRNSLKPLNLSFLQYQVIEGLLQDNQGNHFELARFQVDATVQQFYNLKARSDRALAIGAGTGAGKTKAFYIPALAFLAEQIDHRRNTQIIAIYPRTELLKDQLKETFSEARKLDKILAAAGKRPIAIGAYYGDVPFGTGRFDATQRQKWGHGNWLENEQLDGYECPYFVCHKNDCNEAAMVWRKAHLEQQQEILTCTNCGNEVHDLQLMLTRNSMVNSPPDILFTTTEMLNRRLSKSKEHALFGIDAQQPPRLVLLDEIHTYEGITGAQVGYLLRRWQYARKRNGKKGNLCIVGLSATLTNPETFFSKLTGLDFQKGQVAYVAPREEDLEEQGMEYNIVLKGNPAAATSLLSTSVQTMMLLGRMQDSENIANHREKTVSLGSFGRKVFGFTDNLDVINRWFYIQYDAEQRKQLAQFRDVNQIQSELGLHEAQLATVSEQGQIWSAAGIIGHELQNGLRIGRTSSQDRGYDVDAELIIASSTLEVGFNDKRVGAVVQHKAPRSMASFLQRKGRAGRTRSMRPWLAVVTSAYGRDRWAFQHATALFNPKLAATQLPLTNDYVRKIQAAYVLMDWLALKLKLQRQNADLWSALNSNQQKQNVERTQSRRHWENQHRRLVALLTGILNGRYLNKFQTYLQEALRLDVQDIHIVLWRQPRSILFSVIPTALRQLETQWQAFDINGEPEKWIDRPASTPLPDFVPAALFSDLNLPELTLQLPPTFNQEEEDTVETMALLQGMREFAPARANKRFMLAHHADIAHWLNVPDTDPETHQLDLLDWEAVEVEGRVAVESGGVTYAVFRPIRYHLTEVPSHIRSTSYSELRWRSSFLPQTASLSSGNRPIGKQIDLPAGSQWSRLISTIDLYTQADGAWVEVNRLADCVQIETKYKDGTTMRRLVKFVVEDGQSAALGFNLAVDALRFRFVPPDFSQLQAHPDWGNIYRSLRSRYFFDVLKQDVRLNDLSVFEIEWLWQLELSLLTMIAIEQQCSLATAAQIAQTQRFERTNTVFDHIFQAQQIDDEGDDVLTSRLQERLEEHLQNPIVIQVLKEAAVALWSPNQQAFEAWLTDCYASSLGATLFNVVVRLVPDIEPDDLVMDIDTGCIWISEKSLGGIGLITRIADEISQYPRRFELQLLDTLAYCEREQLAGQLDDVTGLISSGNHDLQTAFSIVRTETDLPTLLQTQTILRQIFESNGIPATRQLFVEMNSKFLRPNSAEDSDQLVSIFTDQWRREEQRLDIDIDLRVMAVAGSQIKVIQAQVQTVMQRLGGRVDDQSQVFNLLQSLLWLNCHDSCPDCIQTWNPYQPQTHPSRPLIAMMLQPYGRIVRFGEAYWETTGQDSLREHFQVEIRCDVGEINACKIALLNWLVSPIDIGFQTFYPVIERIERLGQDWRLHLIIQELVGA